MARYDIVIRRGTVVDGLGGAPFVADIAIKDGRIAAVGTVADDGTEEIDAAGRIVTPGFVDIHTHYDGQVTWEHTLAPSSNHGVTTVVMGNCGVGFAPAKPDQHDLVLKLMEGVEDVPKVVMAEGVPWNWETFPDYLDALSRRHADIDFAAQLPHSPLRVYVMGDRGVNLEPPTPEDLAEMRRLTAEGIEAGALGVTTSRSHTHRFRDGRLAPSVPTEEQELLALAAGLRDAGKGVFQLIPRLNESAAEEFRVIRRIAEVSGRPVSFTLLADSSGDWRNYFAGLEQAKRDNLQIRGQILPRPAGVLYGLDLSIHPFCLNPSYRPVARLPLAEKVAAMRDPALRAKIISEEPTDPHAFLCELLKRMHPLFVLDDPPNYIPAASDSIRARAAVLGVNERELLYDELLSKGGRSIIYAPTGNIEGDFYGIAAEMLGKQGTVLGLGDGGAHYGMLCDAPYTTFLLCKYVRDKNEPRRVPLERAISMLSRETAEAVGLNDRGVLKPGYKADVNIIDLEALNMHLPHVVDDLPAGGRRLMQKVHGYDATIVSGQVIYRRGEATGALPGRLVRGGQPRPCV